nr:hypothetical protein [Nostoc sp. UCD121]
MQSAYDQTNPLHSGSELAIDQSAIAGKSPLFPTSTGTAQWGFVHLDRLTFAVLHQSNGTTERSLAVPLLAIVPKPDENSANSDNLQQPFHQHVINGNGCSTIAATG